MFEVADADDGLCGAGAARATGSKAGLCPQGEEQEGHTFGTAAQAGRLFRAELGRGSI